MKTPKYGSTITKMIHAALPQPERSRRLNTSPKTVIRSQHQITHAKNTSIVQITSRNGYELAITNSLLCRIDCDRPQNRFEPKGLRLPEGRCLSLLRDDCDGWRPQWRFPVR